jgi:hypothetical protein
MKLLQLAGAAALCGALLLTACAKKTTDQSTSSTTTTDTSQAAGATPASDAAATTAPADTTTAPAATSTTASTSTSSTTTAGSGASGDYIEIPIYPGATAGKNDGLSASGNGTSVAMKVYSTKDDSKRVSEWYKDHLPTGWQNSIISAGGKTVGTFVDEHKDGDQSVIVAPQDDGTTRIQLTTKHGK